MGEHLLTCSNEKWSSATCLSTKLRKNHLFQANTGVHKEQGGVQEGGESRAKITRVSQTVQCIGSRLVKCLENLGGEGRGDEFGEVFEGGGGDAGDRAVVHQKTPLGLLTDTFDIP